MALSLKSAHLARYKDLVWLLVKYGRKDLVNAAGLEMGDFNGHAAAADDPATPRAQELAADLEKMGPVFVKIGQLLSTRPDILPPPYIDALTRLQDNLTPIPFSEIEKLVAAELGTRMSRAFSSFEVHPISAASLGQVHRATMRDGRLVAVKVQRPHIREEMVNDLDALHEIADLVDRHSAAGRRIEFARVLEEFRKTLMRELDYRTEARNLKTLHANMAEFQRIVVPLPIDDYTTSRVLTMQYISGAKITSLSPLVKTELDGHVLAEELFRAYLKQILIDGIFHADPHPGNILLTGDSSIALIDLGMVGNLTPSLQESLLRILFALSEGRSEDAVEQTLTISEKRDNFDGQAFNHRVADVISRNQRSSIQQMSVGRIIVELVSIAADCGLRVPVELATIGKTFLNLDEVGAALDPDFQPNVSVRQNAASMMRRRLLKSITPGSLYSGILEAKELAQHFPRNISKILSAAANNELEIRVNALDETRLMSAFQKVANRITVGLILAALIIGAALLMRVDTTFHIFGYPGLAIIFFLLATLGGLLLLVRILFYDEPS